MLAAFGFFMAWGYDAPVYVWIIGALCLVIENRSAA
jgi:hypothetical protein